jgi:hypothetical protein
LLIYRSCTTNPRRDLFTSSEGTSDATIIVLEEISKIAREVALGSAQIDVQAEEFLMYWRGVNERTSSSTSKIHFGHYKVARLRKRYAAFFA